jgi:hypothetical protein
MGALETNTTLIYGVHVRESANDGSDFSNAAADYRVLFLGEDGYLHVKDSAGSVTSPYTSGSFTFGGARVTNATQNITTATVTTLTWDTEAYDTTAYRDAGTPTRLTIPATGKYRVSCGGYFGFSESNEMDLWIALNTNTNLADGIAGQTLHSSTGKHVNVSFDRDFTIADYLQARFYHDNGSTRAFTNGYFTIQRLDP